MFKRIILTFSIFLVAPALINPLYADSASPEKNTSPDFAATYSFSRNGIQLGVMERKLYQDEQGNYVFESVSRATGILSWYFKDRIVERSTWKFNDNQLQPLSYTYNQSGGKKKRDVKLQFHWDKGVVTNTVNNDPWTMEIPDDAQDKLLYQFAIMWDLQSGREELEYNIADGGKLKVYRFSVIGEEKINTPLGTLDAIKLQRVKGKKVTSIWCATNMEYLPVKIEQKGKDDSNLRMVIRKLQGIDSLAAAKQSFEQ